jgi:hypothetical protein
MSLGIYLTLLVGKTVPEPAPSLLVDALQNVEVNISDEGRDGFQIVFSVGRSGLADASEYPLLSSPLIKPFNRVIIMVSFGVVSKVLIDGIITHHQLNPSNEPGKSTLTITGEDLSVMMDMEEKTETFPNQSDAAIVSKIIATYAKYDLVPKVITPDSMETPIENNIVSSQQTTDLKYLHELAKKYSHVFYVEPTDAPKVNTAYWGPPDREGKPQKALSFNMGEFTNVNFINFQMNALQQSSLSGSIQDTEQGDKFDIPSELPSSSPKLAARPVADFNSDNKIKKQPRESGVSQTDALIMAQTETSNSADAVTATGEIDSTRYNDVLKARHTVALRGVGQSYNGLYYVKQVKHIITKGTYKQTFTLTREGLGSTITKV